MELHFPLILDGATGTQLQKRGYKSEKCTEEWVLEHPDTIQEIQRLYIENGSNIIYSPTFGGNRVKLEENGLFNKVDDYNRRLAALSKEVAAGRAYVAGDLAPTGKFLAPLGDTTFEELAEIYEEQVRALDAAGVDLFVIETMMTVPEARAAILAVKTLTNKPAMVSFTCDQEGRTLTGTDVTAALVILQGMGADAFGLNCSVGPEDMLIQLRRLHDYAEVPLIAKPNAGMPEIEDGKTVYKCKPEEFALHIKELADTGVAIFGGCCGSTEEHIHALYEGTRDITIAKPAPLHPELLPLASEKKVCLLPADVTIDPTQILSCSRDLAEQLEEENDREAPVTAIRISELSDLDEFADNQCLITKPLCLVCEDADLLERALRLYQGRAMYEGSLPEAALLPLQKRYGLIF